MTPQVSSYLQELQPLLSLPRETVPQLTASETRKALRWAADALGLELLEKEGVVPWFLLVPREPTPPRVLLFGAWHAEVLPVLPAAIEGAERLALAAMLASIGPALGEARGAALVVAPGATQGSLVLSDLLRQHRSRLQAPAALWPRIAPQAPRRRRIYLGARGRVVLGLWTTEGSPEPNPYRIRDQIVGELAEESYGPRPLDFELLRKLSENADALDFLEETLDDPRALSGKGEERLKQALFAPRGHVLLPPTRHPDRPQAWIALETAESMEPSDLLERVRGLAGGTRVEMAEGFLWDRIGIHHPSVQAEIKLSKDVSEGPEIWPSSPWITPAGIFTRALGTSLVEWAIPVPASVAIRFPKPRQFEAIVEEASELIRRSVREVEEAGSVNR